MRNDGKFLEDLQKLVDCLKRGDHGGVQEESLDIKPTSFFLREHCISSLFGQPVSFSEITVDKEKFPERELFLEQEKQRN
jgi:hypothetical protein